jgi:hypothetical protein
MQHQRTVESEIYYDNISFLRTSDEYVPDNDSGDNEGTGGNEGSSDNEGSFDSSDTDFGGAQSPW